MLTVGGADFFAFKPETRAGVLCATDCLEVIEGGVSVAPSVEGFFFFFLAESAEVPFVVAEEMSLAVVGQCSARGAMGLDGEVGWLFVGEAMGRE